MGLWGSFKNSWGFEDEIPLTDPSSAENAVVEELISTFQQAVKEATDKLAELSSTLEQTQDRLNKLNNRAILAYTAALNGDTEEVKFLLEKVINV